MTKEFGGGFYEWLSTKTPKTIFPDEIFLDHWEVDFIKGGQELTRTFETYRAATVFQDEISFFGVSSSSYHVFTLTHRSKNVFQHAKAPARLMPLCDDGQECADISGCKKGGGCIREIRESCNASGTMLVPFVWGDLSS